MKFRTKPSTVDAIIFNYNPAGIAALMEFAGNDFTGFHKAREAGSKAVATIAGRAFQEGCYVVREDHDFRPVQKDIFEAMYEAMPVFPVPPVWPTVPTRKPAEKKEAVKKVARRKQNSRRPKHYYDNVRSLVSLHRNTMTYNKLAEKLNSLGSTTPSGKPWNAKHVNNFIGWHNLR